MTILNFITVLLVMTLLVLKPNLGMASDEDLSLRYRTHHQALQSPSTLTTKTYQEAVQFSLEIGEVILAFYEQQVAEEGLDRILFFERGQHKRPFTYWQSIKETIANTYTVTRLIASHYGGDSFMDETLKSYQEVLETLRSRKMQLHQLRLKLQVCETCNNLNLDDYLAIQQTLFTKHLKSDFLATPFIQSLIKNGIYQTPSESDIAFPLIDDFEIHHIGPFTDPELSHALLEQLNLLNIFMLVRGPQLVELFGKSSLGQNLIRRLNLNESIHKISQLQWPLNSVFLWLALETADGCIVRYSYLTYAVHQKISLQSRRAIEKYLMDHLRRQVAF